MGFTKPLAPTFKGKKTKQSQILSNKSYIFPHSASAVCDGKRLILATTNHCRQKHRQLRMRHHFVQIKKAKEEQQQNTSKAYAWFMQILAENKPNSIFLLSSIALSNNIQLVKSTFREVICKLDSLAVEEFALKRALMPRNNGII